MLSMDARQQKVFFTGNLWSHLQRFDHKILRLVLIIQDALLTVNGFISNIFKATKVCDSINAKNLHQVLWQTNLHQVLEN